MTVPLMRKGRNWKTTMTGISLLVMSALRIYFDHSAIADASIQGSVLGGIGLIFAKDAGNIDGTTVNTTAPVTMTVPSGSETTVK